MSEINKGYLFPRQGFDVPGPPADWALNDVGQPTWIAATPETRLAEWVTILLPLDPSVSEDSVWRSLAAIDLKTQMGDSATLDAIDESVAPFREFGPAAMPAISWLTPRERRRGNPGLHITSPATARAAAWLADIRAWSIPKIGEQLLADPCNHRTRRRLAKRYIRAGRRLLADQGALPWQIWEAEPEEVDEPESPPHGTDADPDADEWGVHHEWWLDPTFEEHLWAWYSMSHQQAPERLRMAGGSAEEVEELRSNLTW